MKSYRRWRWVCTHASLYSSSPLHRSPIAHAVSTLFGCQVRDVIKKHRVGLQRVFAYYCTQCTELGGASDSMNCDAFLLMLKHAHLLDRHLTPLVVKHVFALTQLVRQDKTAPDEATMHDSHVHGSWCVHRRRCSKTMQEVVVRTK